MCHAPYRVLEALSHRARQDEEVVAVRRVLGMQVQVVDPEDERGGQYRCQWKGGPVPFREPPEVRAPTLVRQWSPASL